MREDGAGSDRAQRLADDGKRFPAMDVAFSNFSSLIGGSLREDGAGLDRAQRLADSYFIVLFVFFPPPFLRSLFSRLSVFEGLWRS